MNIQELWDKCSFCPVCQSGIRLVKHSLAPSTWFGGHSFFKNDNTLLIEAFLKKQCQDQIIRFSIDCQINQFTVGLAVKENQEMDAGVSLEEESAWYHLHRSKPFFWLDANCPKCSSHIHSQDILLNLKTQRLENVEVESETIRLAEYKVDFHPPSNEMDVVRLEPGQKTTYPLSRHRTVPMMELDFANQEETLERLRIAMVFS
jgi:ribosomal protein S27AE